MKLIRIPGESAFFILTLLLAILIVTLPGWGFFGDGDKAQASEEPSTIWTLNGAEELKPDDSLPPALAEEYKMEGCRHWASANTVKWSRIQGVNLPEVVEPGEERDAKLWQAVERFMAANPEVVPEGEFVQVMVKNHDPTRVAHARQVVTLTNGHKVPAFGTTVRALFYEDRLSQFITRTQDNLPAFDPPKVSEKQILTHALRPLTITKQSYTGNHSPNVPEGINDGAIETGPELITVTPTSAKVVELGVLEGELAYQMVVTTEAYGPYTLYLSAKDGSLLKQPPAHANAYNIIAKASSYAQNPVINANPFNADVYHVNSKFHSLYGAYFEVHNMDDGDAVEQDYEFIYDPSDTHFWESMTYYTLDNYKRRLAMDYPQLMNWPIYTETTDNTTGSYYDLATKRIHITDAGYHDDAMDADCTIHEYNHGKHHDVGGSGAYGYPFAIGEPADEALCDYNPTSYFNDRNLSEWIALDLGQDFIRTMNSDYTENNWYPPDPHISGIILGAGLWDLRERIGKPKTDRLATQAVYSVVPGESTNNFDALLETALLQADYDQNGGIHEEIIRKVFDIRLVHGNAGPYNWTTDYIMSDRPYDDNVNETKSYTIPGATELRVTFGPYTRAYYANNDYKDTIHVMDESDVEIATSPFTARELQNKTVTVPGETVKVRLYSIPGNNRQSAGYRVINVVASDPMNLPPIPSLQADKTEGMIPMEVTFDVSGSFDWDGAIIAYTLDPGDGSPVIQLDPDMLTVGHVYQWEGFEHLAYEKTFVATLDVTDNKGEVASTMVEITVEPFDPCKCNTDRGQMQLNPSTPGITRLNGNTPGFLCPPRKPYRKVK